MASSGLEPLLDSVQAWRELIAKGRNSMPNNQHHYYWRFIIGNRVSPFMALWVMVELLGGAFHAETVRRMGNGLRMAITFEPVVHSVAFFASRRRLVCDDLLVEYAELASILEPFCAKRLREMESVRRYCKALLWVCKAYTLTDTVVLIIPVFFKQDRMELELWPWPEGRAWVIVGSITLFFLGAPCAFPTFIFIALYMCCVRFEVAIYHLLGDAIEQADTRARIKEVAELDARFNAAAVRLKHTMDGVTASLLCLLLITPLISTVFAVLGEFDLFTFVSIPYVALFIYLCQSGQELQDASGSVATAAYYGKWTEVRDVQARRTVLLLQTRRTRSLGITTSVSNGSLNRAMCRETMNSWYSLVQLLLKTL